MLFLTFLLALLPIIWLIVALSVLKIPGHKACAVTLAITLILAVTFWKLNVIYALSGVLEGVLNGLWPICLVIISALFVYNLTVKTGAMESIKQMLGSVSNDRRVMALLIGWGFGNFMEGMAGFGTAVAIPASMLVGVGMNPLNAVLGCLVVNSTPTAFGSVGVPTQTLAAVTGQDVIALSSNVVLLECLLTLLSPFLMVVICGGGVKALKGMIPTTLIASVSFVLPWYIAANNIGPELPNIIGSIFSMVCIILASRIFNKEPDPDYALEMSDGEKKETLTLNASVRAWSPFILIFALLMLTSNLCPPIHNLIAGIKTDVVVYAGEGGSTLTFSWINTPGVMIFLAGILGGLIQGAAPAVMLGVLGETLKKYWKTILTICCVMSTAKLMGYSGMISDIASFLVVAAGPAYPLISPLIGALGGFVTGSGTSTSVLFGQLQSQTAQSLGLDPAWMAAANISGGGIGKMICPQSIAIGTGAAGMIGAESKILGAVFKYFLFYVVVAGLLCFAGAMVL